MVLSYLVAWPWKDPQGYNFPQTITAEVTKIPRLVSGYRVHIGLVIAPAIAGVLGLAPHLRARRAGRARARGRALCRLLVAPVAVDGAARLGRHGGLAGGLEAAGPLGRRRPMCR